MQIAKSSCMPPSLPVYVFLGFPKSVFAGSTTMAKRVSSSRMHASASFCSRLQEKNCGACRRALAGAAARRRGGAAARLGGERDAADSQRIAKLHGHRLFALVRGKPAEATACSLAERQPPCHAGSFEGMQNVLGLESQVAFETQHDSCLLKARYCSRRSDVVYNQSVGDADVLGRHLVHAEQLRCRHTCGSCY
jgi:hypothetical protein